MAFIPFANSDGSPDVGALYSNATLCLAMYEEIRDVFQIFANLTGSELRWYDDKPGLRPIQSAVFRLGNEVLIVLDGTADFAQWFGHAGSFVTPWPDPYVPAAGTLERTWVMANFWNWAVQMFDLTHPFYADLVNPVVRIIGHSFAGAVAHIMGRHLANIIPRPQRIEIMTFGEPRSYWKTAAVSEPDLHLRIVTVAIPTQPISVIAVDPVTLLPPGFWGATRLSGYFKWLAKLLILNWGHFGTPWLLSPTGITEEAPFFRNAGYIPGFDYAAIVLSSPLAALHHIQLAYWPHSLQTWRNQDLYMDGPILSASSLPNPPGTPINLRSFDRYISDMQSAQLNFPQTIGPALLTSQIEQGWGVTPAETVTPDNYYDWGVFSAEAGFFSSQSPQVIYQGGQLPGMDVTIGGSGGGRTWWLYRGKDRLMIQKALLALNIIADRDAKAPVGQQKVFPGDNEALEIAVSSINVWLQILLDMSRASL